MDWKALAEIGSNVAIVLLFLWYQDKFFNNHLSKLVDAVQRLADHVDRLDRR